VKASREMDKLIAEHVFGWKFREDDYGGHRCENCGCATTENTRIAIEDIYNIRIGICDGRSCHYSTGDDAAWAVVRKMYAEGFDIHTHKSLGDVRFQTDGPASIASVIAGVPDSDWVCEHHMSESFPLAVCMAALRALGAEE